MSFLRKLVNKATPFRGSLKKDRPTSVGASSTPTPTTPRPQQVQPAPQPQPQQNGTSQPGRTTFRTTTRTEPDGTVTKTIVETRPDGTVITTTETTHPNGKTSTTKNVKQGTGAPAPSSSNVGPPSGSACALNGGSSKAPGPANDVIRQKDRDHVPPPDRVAFPPGNKVRDEPVKDALGKVNRANEAKDPKYSGPPLSFKGICRRAHPDASVLYVAHHPVTAESDFASIDAHARSCPPSSATNVPALAKYLTSPYKPTLYKVRAIFAWVTANIQYDTKSYFSGSYGPQGVDDVLKKRIAVCAGYAGLVKELCDAAGVVCIVVPGYGRGFGSTPGDMTIERTPDGKPTGHAWNAVLVQGEWRFIDATWGAGNVTPSRTYEPLFTPHWFLTRPTHMIFTHCPRDPVNQLLSPPISEQDFVNLPYIRHRFLEGEGCVLIKPRAAKVAVRDEWVEVVVAVSGLIKAVQAKFTFTMGGVKKEYGAHVVPAFENGRRVVKVRTLCPGKGEGDLEVYGFTEDEV
ncbi:hypothetical protein HK104_004716 [Borealophlyctis nickersoniae]|nr:hypothetical protein HK104_004716 [Borealophlyctis nickersoniae]